LQAYRQLNRDPRLLASLGRLYQKEGQNRQAVEYCEKAKGLLPDDAEVQRKTGECLDRAREELAQEAKKPTEAPAKLAKSHGEEPTTKGGISIENKPVINSSPTTIIQLTSPPAAPAVPAVIPMVNPAPMLSPAVTERSSIGTKWWLWTGIGVVVAGAVGLGVGLAGGEPDRGNTMVRPFSLSVH